MIIRVGEFNGMGRLGFGAELNNRGLNGVAVEIGTHRAEFACHFLHRWNRGNLICVDPWIPYDDGDPASVGDREADHAYALSRLSRYGDRVQVMRTTSLFAAPQIPDGSLDFVYIDGNHRKAFVEQDLRLWWPKLRSGGLLAGHDIICPAEANGGWAREIQPPVFDFSARHDVDLYLIPETTSSPWSYFFVKP